MPGGGHGPLYLLFPKSFTPCTAWDGGLFATISVRSGTTFHISQWLVGVEDTIDFRLDNRLLKGNAGQHFEGPGRETRIPVRCFLFTICGQALL
jgi:hypothetical protein